MGRGWSKQINGLRAALQLNRIYPFLIGNEIHTFCKAILLLWRAADATSKTIKDLCLDTELIWQTGILHTTHMKQYFLM